MKIVITNINKTVSDVLAELSAIRKKELALAAQKIVLELSIATPIDTGEAMRGWQMSEKSDKFLIANDVPHIELLNNGHSEQAPARFVERVLLTNGKAVGTLITTKPG